jgi:DNA polymerase-3 subunit delta'
LFLQFIVIVKTQLNFVITCLFLVPVFKGTSGMLLRDVVGQQAAKMGLLKMWQNNVFPHALLLTGMEGVGGLPLGLALAQYIFCENKTEFDACGQCPGCSKAAKLEHADLHISYPSISPKAGTKAMSRYYMQEFREFIQQSPYGTTYDWLQHINAENKQGNITAEECREIIDQLNLKSYEGGAKVLLMWRPEYLGKEGNILLKLIEEPPKDTIMIFIAENTEDILPTIRSRTQAVKLAPLLPADIAQALSGRSLADPVKAAQVAQIAMGSYTEALRLIRHADNDLFPDVRNLFNSMFTNNGVAISKFVDEWSKVGREQQKNLLHYVIQLVGQAIRARYTPQANAGLPPAESQFVQKLAATGISFEAFGKLTDVLTNAIYYIERNAHGKTQLHAMAIRMQQIIQGREMAV